jgi:hypothetical protein
MNTIKKIFGAVILFVVITAIILVVFREQIKVAAVRKYVEQWTENLLQGAAIDPGEKEKISRKFAEFYALAVEKIIPQSKVEEVWDKEGLNQGFWYFYLKNFFTELVADSGMATLARQKARGTVDKFLSYIKDGRVSRKDLYELQKDVRVFHLDESPLNKVEDKDVQNAVNRINAVNEELEKRGPGKPIDPVDTFKKLVQKVEEVTEKYRPKKEE